MLVLCFWEIMDVIVNSSKVNRRNQEEVAELIESDFCVRIGENLIELCIYRLHHTRNE